MTAKNSVSLVIIDTDTYRLARNAVDKTLKQFPVDDVLIFSDEPSYWEGYPIIQIKKISRQADYNALVLKELVHHLKTDFALMIQFDGFVINPESFSEFFYKFDYLGAPWPAGIIPNHGPMVGNGGFSLRSKRLIEALAKRDSGINFDIPEDATVCRFLRPILEEYEGICFAPVEVARHFSFELENPKSLMPFGFHGLHILPLVYRDNIGFLVENLPERCFKAGSYQLKNLQIGFASLDPEAQSLLLKKIEEFK
ncbi:hypothetical protein AAKU67_002749 [Oxalobacteraceae bacterium GrIS 2.11]